MPRRRSDGYVMISIISERYNIHPQTLRLYEREGLIKPARTAGNTRLYGLDEIKKLEMILCLTRDLGVNLAGVEVVLQLAQMMQVITPNQPPPRSSVVNDREFLTPSGDAPRMLGSSGQYRPLPPPRSGPAYPHR